jgi:hypothetical protein
MCKTGYNGNDCSLSASAMQSAQAIRQNLCVGLYSTLATQDATTDAMTARFSAIAAILNDITQINTYALSNCTLALVATVQAVPQLAGSPTIAPVCAKALSSVLAAGATLPASLLAQVSAAMSTLSAGVQANMAVGQAPVTLTTANTRTATSLVDPSTIASQSFSAPATAVEQFNKAPQTSLGVAPSDGLSSGSGGVGVSVVQFTNNPLGAATASKTIGVQLSSPSSSGSSSGSRKLLTSNTVITVTLVNQSPVTYSKTLVPACASSTGSAFAVDPACKVVAYSSANTTCTCSYATNPGLIQFASLPVAVTLTSAPTAAPVATVVTAAPSVARASVKPTLMAGAPTATPTTARITAIQVTQTIAGVTLATAQTPAFQKAFAGSLATVLGVNATAVNIVSVTASARRALLAGGVSVVYTLTVLNTPTATLQAALSAAVTSGALTAALVAASGITTISASVLPTVVDISPTSAPTAAPVAAAASPVGAIVGGVVGGVVGLLLVGGGAYYLLGRSKRTGAYVAAGN